MIKGGITNLIMRILSSRTKLKRVIINESICSHE